MTMSLLMIGGGVALALGVLRVAVQAITAPAPRRMPEEQGPGIARYSHDRELRVEYHQSVDRSFSPPKF
jgi:hypothetical protein